jgi:hypothetical protein
MESASIVVTAAHIDWSSTTLCERHLVDFVQEAWPLIESADFIDNWHISAICGTHIFW